MKNGMTMGLPRKEATPFVRKAFILLSNKSGCSFTDRQGSLRSLTAFPFYRFAMGNDGGLAPIPLPEGFHPSDSLLRFARFQAAFLRRVRLHRSTYPASVMAARALIAMPGVR